MSDNDLIRRGDALAAVQEWTYCCDAEDAIAALPAVTVDEEAFMTAVWGALKADATDLGKQQRILAAFRAALEPVAAPDPALRPTMTDMMVDPNTLNAFMEANPLPPDPAPAKQVTVSEAEAIREAALREAADAVEDYCSDMPDLAGHGHSVGLKDAILALIQKGADDEPR